MDLGDLSKRMTMYAKAVEKSAVEVVKEAATAVGPPVVYGTPVDTSRARSNWQGSIGSPKAGVLFSPPLVPPTEHSGAIIGIRSIDDAVKGYKGQSGGIWIVNNLYYIIDLNNGSSTQAPKNFVEMAVTSGLKRVRSFRLINTFR